MSQPSAIPAGSQADAVFLPAPELPRGGLAVHGMGEHWNINTQTGALSVCVPLATSPGRAATRADLSLNYADGGLPSATLMLAAGTRHHARAQRVRSA